MTEVRTRFAPSPTGYMHIGGMRTALFNWLWARHNGGKFILRIDDTDRERNVEAALEPIFAAFRWLELDWDEGPDVGGPHGPYYQSQRGELYHAAVKQLLAENKAYRCYDTPEQIQADRQQAEQDKRPYLNTRRSLELSESQRAQHEADGNPGVVRLLVPRDQKVIIEDAVRGRVEWDCGLISDPVIVRANGSPLYNFATVVDDAQLEITHVIRAEEHLSNTPTQVLLYEALGYTQPVFAHISFVTAPGTSKKLSKRDISKYRNNPAFRKMFEAADNVFPAIGLGDSDTLNPVMVEYYEKIGYLPEAVFNGLSRFGWSLDDKTEIMSRETIIDSFTLDRVVKSPAGFDPDKLLSYQVHWMNQRSLDEKIDGCLPYLIKASLVDEAVDASTREFVGRLITVLDDRIKVFSDILEHADFFAAEDELPYDDKAFDKRVRKEGAAELLVKFRSQLADAEQFDAASLDALMHSFVDAEGIKIGEIIHAVRVAVTGKAKGPGLFDCLELLGKDRALRRFDRALEKL